MIGLKAILKRAADVLGFEVHRRSRGYPCHIYDFPDQKVILLNQPPEFILDIGGHEGQSVTRYRKLFPNATIHSFEPVPESFSRLQELAAADSLLKCWPFVVCDVAGEAQLHVNARPDTSSLFPTSASQAERSLLRTERMLTVPSVTLDGFCEQHDVSHVGILKLDIQGGEMLALKGATHLLERQAIDLVFTEAWFQETYECAPLLHDLDGLLRRYGYVLYGLYNLSTPFQVYNEPIEACDAIYIRRDLVSRLDRKCGGFDSRWGRENVV